MNLCVTHGVLVSLFDSDISSRMMIFFLFKHRDCSSLRFKQYQI